MQFENMLISENTSLIEAMRSLDESAKKVLFVLREGKLIASLSDGDIRRWLLAGGGLDAPVSKMANYHPKYMSMQDKKTAEQYIRQHHLDALPIVNEDNEIIDIICIYGEEQLQRYENELKDVPVVIMAGGLGTRLYPYTKILPKPLIPVGDIPITEHIINQFRAFGCSEFYMIVNHKKNMIKAYYNEIEKDYALHFVDEDVPLGTGGGVGLLKGMIDSTFILTNCDSLILEDYTKIVREHRSKHNAVTMICSLKNFNIPYGIVEIGSDGGIETMKEKPQYSFFTNTGTYIVEPDIVSQIEPRKAVDFPNVIQSAKDKGMNVGVYPINEKAWLDMGQFDTLEDMRQRLGYQV